MRKSAYEHEQSSQIQIILRMRQYRPGLYSPFIHSVESNLAISGQGRPWSDCADAQADLDPRCPHMPEGTFSHDSLYLA